jgi:membrane associated rhomboid family serine protease
MFQLSPVVKMLLVINGLVFLLGLGLGNSLMIDLFGLRYLFSDRFVPTQLLSYAVVHADFSHLFSNMLGLLVFGPILEMRLGPKRFLFFYYVEYFVMPDF